MPRTRRPYPSDLTCQEWDLLEPLPALPAILTNLTSCLLVSAAGSRPHRGWSCGAYASRRASPVVEAHGVAFPRTLTFAATAATAAMTRMDRHFFDGSPNTARLSRRGVRAHATVVPPAGRADCTTDEARHAHDDEDLPPLRVATARTSRGRSQRQPRCCARAGGKVAVASSSSSFRVASAQEHHAWQHPAYPRRPANAR
jgi:hypothetical protein